MTASLAEGDGRWTLPAGDVVGGVKRFFASENGALIVGGSADGWDLLVGVRTGGDATGGGPPG